MKPNKENIKLNDTIIFKHDEFRDGYISEFDGHVLFVGDNGVDVTYLSGYRSRNDFIPWSDIIAKVDKRKPFIKLENAPYSGHFVVYA